MALTDPKIKQAKPKDKDYKLGDSRGLYLLVTKTGAKYWRLKYRFLNKEKVLALGVYPTVTLKQARKACDTAKDQLEKGIDPAQARKAKKAELTEAQSNNLETLTREWHLQQTKKWSQSYSEKVLRSVERDLFPYLGTLPLDDITPPQLLAVLRRIESRGATESAHRLKQTVGQVFRFAVATGRAQRDITPDLKGALATHKKQHFPAITEPAQVGRLLNMLDIYEGTPTVRAALKLAPLVFVRPKELRHAEWQEIDFDKKEWRIPATKMKMGVDHIVPLSRQALEVLNEQRCITGHWGGYVFPSARSPRRPMSDNAILSAFRNMGISKDEMTGHGFRAMARTILDEVLGERVELIEHQLAHAVKDSLGRAYNRTKHLPQRKKMMQRWADYLDDLRLQANSSNVVTANFTKATLN
ncbi:MAG TPA: integrase [Gammaproteobacteria bacterium]|jgi:integrase|nr:integrase arm-type DNA-binding domain-containing protein [Gammaproteobacteria bacterium]MDP6734049.1 integrase arm-type DNA-binding domain-containing protein [Gammaproteobacteria bacterium]HAJ74945.1 integrase [Gammaproteobacteria bacterium]|tara:strand:- start:387 stop:1628 length:1242 start_codon:yes stop_codon:yes gene_type:complete